MGMFGYRSNVFLVVAAAAFSLLLSAAVAMKMTTAFVVVTPTTHHHVGHLSMMAGGFGSGGSSKKKKETKLKPKAQWDRYLALKKETPMSVAVRKDGDEWLEVGKIKSKDNANTITAVARQRALIADHARRLFPLQISPKDRVEWAYFSEDGDWVIVDKNAVVENAPNIEKQIGFEGKPDPATGFYCYYNEGRLVNSSDEQAPALSKKLK